MVKCCEILIVCFLTEELEFTHVEVAEMKQWKGLEGKGTFVSMIMRTMGGALVVVFGVTCAIVSLALF